MFVLSIDWSSDADLRPAQRRGAHQEADKLVRLLQRYELPATWGIPRPADSFVSDLLSRSTTAHEVALLATAKWVGGNNSRRQFAEQLQYYIEHARAQGLLVQSLALPNGHAIEHIDLVQKQQLIAVRADDTRPRYDQTGQPYAVKFGLWNVPVNRTISTGAPHWLFGDRSIRGARRVIRHTIVRGTTAHVVIDISKIGSNESPNLKALETIFRHVSNAREAGHLAVHTMADVARQRSVSRRATPTESILRRAA